MRRKTGCQPLHISITETTEFYITAVYTIPTTTFSLKGLDGMGGGGGPPGFLGNQATGRLGH